MRLDMMGARQIPGGIQIMPLISTRTRVYYLETLCEESPQFSDGRALNNLTSLTCSPSGSRVFFRGIMQAYHSTSTGLSKSDVAFNWAGKRNHAEDRIEEDAQRDAEAQKS
jgi:hypothetical protein